MRYEVLVPLVLWPELQVIQDEGSAPRATAIGLHIFYSASANQPVPVLVGFLRRAERDFFRKFTTVEGIGPAKAVKAMNISVSTIARAIEQEDRATLTRLPGIGARGADKIIATLRGKVVAEAAMADGGVERPVDATEPTAAASSRTPSNRSPRSAIPVPMRSAGSKNRSASRRSSGLRSTRSSVHAGELGVDEVLTQRLVVERQHVELAGQLHAHRPCSRCEGGSSTGRNRRDLEDLVPRDVDALARRCPGPPVCPTTRRTATVAS